MKTPTPKELSECLKEKGLPRAREVMHDQLIQRHDFSKDIKNHIQISFESGYEAALIDLSRIEV